MFVIWNLQKKKKKAHWVQWSDIKIIHGKW